MARRRMWRLGTGNAEKGTSMKVARKGAIPMLVSVVCLLATASLAQAIIQVQHGISGVRLNMSPSQVKAGLGKPDKAKHGSNDFGSFTRYKYQGGIVVTFQGNKKV